VLTADARGGYIIPQNWIFAYNNFRCHCETLVLFRRRGNLHFNQRNIVKRKLLRRAGFGYAASRLLNQRPSSQRQGNHKENAMRRMFGFLIGIMVGALVGSTVALLLAPDAGERLRNELRARGEGLISEIRRAGEARRIELTERLDALRAPRAGS
jgi:hypothetical protein